MLQKNEVDAIKQRDIMGAKRLFKYLDVDGGLSMLKNHNLQFTNTNRLNDPFDSHPALFDYSIPDFDVFEDGVKLQSSDFFSKKGKSDMANLRDSTWICSLSKVFNSILMWSYYNNHKGICIGINMKKLRPNLSNLVHSPLLGALELEVNYDEIIKKPNYFLDDHKGYWEYQVSTKSKEWSHEQEVRLTLMNARSGSIPESTPIKPEKVLISDWKDARYYPVIDKTCFESVYLGIKIDEKRKKEIIEIARIMNPKIKIYQMTMDPEAFRLKEELITR